MKIIAVDDEQLMLDALIGSIREAEPDAEVVGFRRASDALKYAQEHPLDVAFLDIRMRGIDGLELGRRMSELYPEINLIYCTSYYEYLPEAFRNERCSGYITKPVDADEIRTEMEHLKAPKKIVQQKRILFRCLGRFEVYVDGEPLKFENAKTKELLACLVDAEGNRCASGDLMKKLWEDGDPHVSCFETLWRDLTETLAAFGCEEILDSGEDGMGIRADLVECDYYEWKAKNPGERPDYYMSQYYWAMIPEIAW